VRGGGARGGVGRHERQPPGEPRRVGEDQLAAVGRRQDRLELPVASPPDPFDLANEGRCSGGKWLDGRVRTLFRDDGRERRWRAGRGGGRSQRRSGVCGGGCGGRECLDGAPRSRFRGGGRRRGWGTGCGRRGSRDPSGARGIRRGGGEWLDGAPRSRVRGGAIQRFDDQPERQRRRGWGTGSGRGGSRRRSAAWGGGQGHPSRFRRRP
jgi:hypothetical protein